MIQALNAHFSRKVLFLSLIFLLANLGIYALKNVSQSTLSLESVAPKLISATAEEVEIKSAYDTDFRPASQGQEIYSGTVIRTTEAEFAELTVGNNAVRLDENTEVELLENNFMEASAYLPEVPRLVLKLKQGSIWVNAFDLVEVRSKRAMTDLHHAVGIVTYSEPINRLMVVTGDVNLSLLGEDGALLSEFVIPLHNQVTFVDAQITNVYKALKPSKLKKELKMAPLSEEILKDEWVARNANDFSLEKNAFQNSLINSGVVYRMKRGFQKAMSYITFVPSAKRSLALDEAKTMLSYLLGGVQATNDLATAKEVIAELEDLFGIRRNDPLMKDLVTKTLFTIENAGFRTPAYELKEVLMDEVEQSEGSYVYRIYLSDARRMLFEGKVSDAESILNKWGERWTQGKMKGDYIEYDRQSQILNHTILAHIASVPIAILEIFDRTGENLIALSDDPEETKFEVTQNRLQVAASLVSHYQYALAKQYLKNSYLGLNIEAENPDLPFTKIFLENGRLLAQRIEYAEDILHGAAEPIDETLFREYYQNRTRDAAFAQDLKAFFELEEEESVDSSVVEAPTAMQVSRRFLEARINLSESDIRLLKGAGFSYEVRNARLLDRGKNNQTLLFNAVYDYKSNSVSQVEVEGKVYKGSFTLSDIVLVLKKGDELVSDVYAPKIDETGIDLLITDEEKLVAMEGQLIAQDVAKQLTYNELTAAGIMIPDVKNGITILDTLNLDKFRITDAFISETADSNITISFDYNSQTTELTGIRDEEGVLLLEKVGLSEASERLKEKVEELKRNLEIVDEFNIYLKQNDLYIYPDDIHYLDSGFLQVIDLEMLSLGLKVTGIYNPKDDSFITVSHSLLSSQNIRLKDYFEELARLEVVRTLSEEGISVTEDQVETDYPFSVIHVKEAENGSAEFDFDIDLLNGKLLNVSQTGESGSMAEMTFDEFRELASQPETPEETVSVEEIPEETPEETVEYPEEESA